MLLGGADEDSFSSTSAGAGGGDGAPAWAVETGGLPNPLIGFPYDNLLNPATMYAWSAFFSNADAPNGIGLENEYAQMWEYVANYFNGNPDIIGYEIMDEPWAGLSWPLILLGSPNFGAEQLTPFFNQVTEAIRSVDPSTPVWIEPNLVFEDGLSPITLGTVHSDHVVFTYEDYCLPEVLFSSSFLCPQFQELVADRAEAYANAHDIPAVISEFGYRNVGQPIAHLLDVANEHEIGWMNWSFMSNNGITGSGSAVARGTALLLDTNQPPVPPNLDAAKLELLAQPYPQAISGTPESLSFSDGVFQLSYSVEKPDGVGSFPVGSQTTIAVPAIDFP
ncbi:cellulase family glycosylhydrolase, partial [Mycobacterium sp.]|uniref:cellulase family glycosylhydrolase n=1 Tax=Mycobacterium sp. TaxID=1785 RepID=UPI00127FB492